MGAVEALSRSGRSSLASPMSAWPSSPGRRWSREEGEFDWQWLDDAVEALAGAGLKVVMCTPTATPPAWLIRKHPEILPIGPNGQVRNFGSRKHYDHASPIYREHSRRITRAVAERYGQHPAVEGWQTDNEWGCHSTTRSYGGASAVAFREWLERTYGTLDALNQAWGNIFWSQEYTAWSQIDPPYNLVAEVEPLARARFLPLRQRHGDGVPGGAGRHHPRALTRSLDHPQLHDAFQRVRPLQELSRCSISPPGTAIRSVRWSARRFPTTRS